MTNESFKINMWEGTQLLADGQSFTNSVLQTNALTVIPTYLFGAPIKDPVEAYVEQPGGKYFIDLDELDVYGSIGDASPDPIASLEDMNGNSLPMDGVTYDYHAATGLKQSAPGIETIYTDAGQVEVLATVLAAVDEAAHVQPVIMLDAELESVTEEASSGAEAYRADLKELFGDREIKVMPHDDIIRKLDDGSKLFNVLLLKTDMVIPYTSVFIELDCGYWNAEKEATLRTAIKNSSTK